MSKYFNNRILIFFLLIIPVSMMSANTMIISSATIGPSQTFTLNVKINNSGQFVAFQFDLALPSGFSYVESSAALNTTRTNGHLLSAEIIAGNQLRVLGYSQTNVPFAGDTGTVVAFQIQSGKIPGTFPLYLLTPIIGDANQANILTNTTNGSVTVLAPNINIPVSSINFDSTALGSSTTRTLIIHNTGNQPLNITSITFSSSYFSVEGNGAFTIPAGQSSFVTVKFISVVKGTYTKIMTVLSNDPDQGNIIVNLQAIAFAVNELHAGNLSVFSGRQGSLTFSINNMEPFTGFQFDLLLPSPMTYVEGSAVLSGRKTNHIVSASIISGNKLRVVAYSANKQVFSGSGGNVLTLNFLVTGTGGYYSLNLSNVVIGDTLGTNCLSDHFNGALQIAAPYFYCSSSLAFGDVSVLATAHNTLQVSNFGNDTLKITQALLSNPSYTLVTTLPQTILPGQSKQLEVAFHQTMRGASNGTMKIYNNDPEAYRNPFNVNLTANAYVPNYLAGPVMTCRNIDTIWIPVKVSNIEPFVGFQFDMSYPSFMKYLPNTAQSGLRSQDHVLNADTLNKTMIRVVCYSPLLNSFTGDTGVVVRLRFAVNNTQSSITSANLTFSNVILGNALMQNILYSSLSGTLNILYPHALNGTVAYNNQANTPMDSVWIILNQNGIKTDSTRSSVTGAFSFPSVYPGDYNFSGKTEKSWGGVNGTDALKIQRHFVGLQLLTIPIRLTAADVNNSGFINGTDATKVQRRFVCLDTTFLRGDWLFENQSGGNIISMGNANGSANIYAICTGDVSGSFTPESGAKNTNLIEIQYDKIKKAGANQELYLPVFLNQELLVGAFSLALTFPNDMIEIQEVTVTQGKVLFHLKGSEIRIVWTDLNPLHVYINEPVAYLKIKTKDTFVSGKEVRFINSSALTEIADDMGNAAQGMQISIPILLFEATANQADMMVFPNPVIYFAHVICNLPEAGSLYLNMFMADGHKIYSTTRAINGKGLYKFDLDVSAFNKGVYIVEMLFNGNNGAKTGYKKLIISR
ncbi:MAG: choice-of-anchor D domain-containing protein [Bacteroidota bacterium]